MRFKFFSVNRFDRKRRRMLSLLLLLVPCQWIFNIKWMTNDGKYEIKAKRNTDKYCRFICGAAVPHRVVLARWGRHSKVATVANQRTSSAAAPLEQVETREWQRQQQNFVPTMCVLQQKSSASVRVRLEDKILKQWLSCWCHRCRYCCSSKYWFVVIR